jgi:hypothetical protein
VAAAIFPSSRGATQAVGKRCSCHRISRVLYLVVLGTLAFSQSSHAETLPIVATFCDLVNDPVRYDHRRIRMRAQFESDGIERVLIIDRSCATHGINILLASGSRKRDVNGHLWDAIISGSPGTQDKKVTAIIVGTYLANAGQPTAPTIVVESFFELHVKRP